MKYKFFLTKKCKPSHLKVLDNNCNEIKRMVREWINITFCNFCRFLSSSSLHMIVVVVKLIHPLIYNQHETAKSANVCNPVVIVMVLVVIVVVVGTGVCNDQFKWLQIERGFLLDLKLISLTVLCPLCWTIDSKHIQYLEYW